MALKPFFLIPTPLGAVTSGNELANRPAAFLGEFNYRGMVWQSSGNSNLWARCSFGSAQDIDFVSMMNANALPGTTIRIRLGNSQASVDGAGDYDSGAISFIDPSITRADGLYHSHHELPSLVSKSWMRVDIGGHTGDFQASMLVAGKKLTVAQYYETQWTREIRDLGQLTFGRNGVPGINRGVRLRATAFKLAWITEAEFEEMFSPIAEKTGKTDPLYVCFDPQATIYRQRRSFFGYNEEQQEYTKQGYNRFSRDYKFLSMF